jgi:hypothetical protein
MSEDEAFLDSGFGAHESYVFGLAANSPARAVANTENAPFSGSHPYVTLKLATVSIRQGQVGHKRGKVESALLRPNLPGEECLSTKYKEIQKNAEST